MRDRLDELRFKAYDVSYSLGLWLEGLTERTKYITLSFLVVSWLSVCSLLFYQSYSYEIVEQPKVVLTDIDIANDTLERAEKLMVIGSNAEAFDILATHKNHFADKYSESKMKVLENNLLELTKVASEADIAVLYTTKDLIEQQPIYKFTGTVISVDTDPMYGVTHMVSNSEKRTQEQLEVTGLVDISVGSQVEFYGVPKFDSVSSPIKVEAYLVPAE